MAIIPPKIPPCTYFPGFDPIDSSPSDSPDQSPSSSSSSAAAPSSSHPLKLPEPAPHSATGPSSSSEKDPFSSWPHFPTQRTRDIPKTDFRKTKPQNFPACLAKTHARILTQFESEEDNQYFEFRSEPPSPLSPESTWFLEETEPCSSAILGPKAAVAFSQGSRDHMEDRHFSASLTCGATLFGVLDGHRGPSAAQFVKDHIVPWLDERITHTSTQKELYDILKTMGPYLTQDYHTHYPEDKAGTTLVLALPLKETLWVAGIGDSRALLVKQDGSIYPLTEDQKPTYDGYYFKKIIGKRGDLVLNLGKAGFRIHGKLAVARAIGDCDCYPEICARAKVSCAPFSSGDLLFLGTDGVAPAGASSQQICDALFHNQHLPLDQLALGIVQGAVEAARQGGGDVDNATGLVVRF